MKVARGSARPNGRALAIVPAEPAGATDMTLSRIETVMNLLLLASMSAASIRAATNSEHDRLHAAMVSSALDEALAEQRILWLELAPTVAASMDEPHRYRDLARYEPKPRRDATELL